MNTREFTIILLFALLTLILDYMPGAVRAVIGMILASIAPGYALLRVMRYPDTNVLEFIVLALGLSFGVLMLIGYLLDIYTFIVWENIKPALAVYFVLCAVLAAVK